MKKVILISLIFMFLSACFSQNEDDLKQNEANIEDNEQLELTILVFQFEGDRYIHINDYANAYMDKFPDTKINMESIRLDNVFSEGRNYEAILHLEQRIAEVKPDIVELFPLHLSLYQDQFLDLQEHILFDGLDMTDFYPALLEATSQQGELLAIPHYFDMNLMYFSKEAFHNQGIPYPRDGWTWEEVFALEDLLSVGVDYNGLVIEQLVSSYGAHMLSPINYEAEGYLNSSETQEALQWIVDHLNHTNDDYAYNNQFQHESDIGMTSLMWVNWYTPGEEDSIAITGIPHIAFGERINPIAVSGFGIHKDSEHPDDAWHFIRQSWIEDNEVSQMVAQKNLMSTRHSVSASSGFDQTPIGQVVIQELAYAQPSSLRLNYIHSTLLDRGQTEFKRLKEGESVEEVVRSILPTWDTELQTLIKKVEGE